MQLTLSSVNVYNWRLIIHDRNNIVVSNSKIYGSDILYLEMNALSASIYVYEVVPTETTFIDQENDPCISAEDLEQEKVFHCFEGYRASLLNCTLPWRHKKSAKQLPLCSHPGEYDKFTATLWGHTDPHSIKTDTKCRPTCTRIAYSTRLNSKWELKKSDSVGIGFFYNQYEVPVREHVWDYDWVNLVSDFGGWLGILLGYSILGFYDTFLLFLGNVKNTMSRKRQLSTTRNQTASPIPVETIKTSIAIQVEPRQASPAI